ncbi:MAG: leucine-rich repeat protein [Treponema sp.]|nr:leucine-rich repeat protein [Treponema sp.]
MPKNSSQYPLLTVHFSLFTVLCSLLLILSCPSLPTPEQAATGPLFSGNGGRGIALAVLEPAGRGLAPNEQWILSLVQSSITGDFNRFSAMTIVDRQNLETVLAEQAQSLSGDYSDEDFIRIGRLTNARLILTGAITKTANSYILEFSVSEVETGERKASYPPRPVTPDALENLAAVKEASADLLAQLGVELTDTGVAELRMAPPARVQAETALARGITAQRQGTEVAALSYYFQAATLDPSLFEAVSRSNVMAADISSGSIGEDVRNDIQWRRDWLARLTETEEYFDDFFRNNSLPFTLFYSTGIQQGAIDYQNETVDLSIETNLHGSFRWAYPVQQALQTVYRGLDATGRKDAWDFTNWPTQSVSNLKPFEKRNNRHTIAVDLINDREQVIGRNTFSAEGSWEIISSGLPEFLIEDGDIQTVVFSGVKVDDITDNLSIRIATINGMEAEVAARNRVLQVRALEDDRFRSYSLYAIRNGIVIGYYNEDRLTQNERLILDIPDELWEDLVYKIGESAFKNKRLISAHIPNGIVFIGDEAFMNNRITRIRIPNSVVSIGNGAFRNNAVQYEGTNVYVTTNVTIPNSVVSIGDDAFRNNSIREIIIPFSIVSIGNRAFWDNTDLTKITIGNDVRTRHTDTAFDNNFQYYYSYVNDRKAGTYVRFSSTSARWRRRDI